MQPKSRRLVTEQNLEEHTESELGPVRVNATTAKEDSALALAAATEASTQAGEANQNSENAVSRVGHLESMAGLEPGEVTDAQTANLVTQPETLTRSALNDASVRAIAQAMGAVFVYSTTPPEETTMYGVPVVWITPTLNTIPEIVIDSLTAQGLNATVRFTGDDPDDDPLSYTINWGDGQSTHGAQSPASHTYTESGTYTVSVTADDGDAQGTTSRDLFVSAPLPNRWAADSFSHPDGTILAGWASPPADKHPGKTTEIGNLLWEPGDQSTGQTNWASSAQVWGGRFANPPGETTSRSAALYIPEPSARMAVDYKLRAPGEPTQTLARVSMIFAASEQDRWDVSTTPDALIIRLADNKELQFWSLSAGTFERMDHVTMPDLPDAGRLEVSYNAVTGEVYAWINGDLKLSGTYGGPPSKKVGLEIRHRASADNFEVGPL